MENERGFNLIGLLCQIGLFIILIIALIIIFPTKGFVRSNNSDTNNKVSETVLFNQNLTLMKDAGREYFTIQKMPKEDGSSVTLTLEEMLEKKMVADILDKNGDKCNVDASYIKVTKDGKEYTMDVVLTCAGETKKIVTTIGCYDYCEGSICEKNDECTTDSKTLYEYSKTVKGSSYWTGWSNWSKNKVVATSTKQVETKIGGSTTGSITTLNNPITTKNYYCPSGYNLSSDKTKCSKVISNTDNVNVTITTTKSCTSGYTLSSDKTKCSKTTYDYKEKIAIYACRDSSYSLSGTTCNKKTTITATPHISVSFDCLSGVCQTVSKVDYYYCPSGYKLSGKSCYKTQTTSAYVKNYKCPSGYTEGSSNCYKNSIDTIEVITTTNKTCPSGYTMNGEYCYRTVSGVETIKSLYTTKYSCNEGILKNNKCEVITTIESKVTYYRYRTYVTSKSKTYTKWSSSSNDSSLINNGYKKTGKTKVEKTRSCK